MGPFLFVSELNNLSLPPVFTVLARKLQVTIYEFDLMLYADSLEGVFRKETQTRWILLIFRSVP